MRMTRRRYALLATLAALAAGVSCACAQAIFTTVPSALSRISVRPAASSAQPAAPVPGQFAPQPAQSPLSAQSLVPQPAPQFAPIPEPASPLLAVTQPVGEDATVLRHLTNNIQGFRLAGEIGTTEWPVYLTGAQARQKLHFQVGYLTAVSVMPESSFLTLMINDVVVGRINIRSTHAVRTASFDIPPSLMQPGFNSIRLTAEQRHRVDCSLQATYELWTQIDPAQTGIVLQRQSVGFQRSMVSLRR